MARSRGAVVPPSLVTERALLRIRAHFRPIVTGVGRRIAGARARERTLDAIGQRSAAGDGEGCEKSGNDDAIHGVSFPDIDIGIQRDLV